MTNHDPHIKTRIVHSGPASDPSTGASSVPLYLSSTFDQRSGGKWDYARSGNPTRDALENAIATLEGGFRGFAFSSGMAALSSVLMMFKPGDHLIACDDIYGGTFRALSSLFKNWGLSVTFVDTTRTETIQSALRPETRGLIVESPSNPLLKITDLGWIADFASEHNLISIVDNTFCTPYLQKPLNLGFDIVVHSATKFLNGHSDVVAGLAVVQTQELADRLGFVQNAFGAILGVSDCWLVLRGLRTLAIRMDASQTGAQSLAERLNVHKDVKAVFYPGLKSHPGHELHASQARGPGAVLSFELADHVDVTAFLERVGIALVAVSLGGVETILSHPATMSHASMPGDERLKRGITDSLVRCSVGIEEPEDLWQALKTAFQS